MLFGLANRTIPTALCIADAQEGRGDLPYPLPEWGGWADGEFYPLGRSTETARGLGSAGQT